MLFNKSMNACATISNVNFNNRLFLPNHKLEDPYNNKDLKVNYPSILICTPRRYNEVKDRKEVVTESMFEYLTQKAAEYPVHSLGNSLKDWIVWSQYSGPQRSEWY